MARIHHTVSKKAAKFGITLEVIVDDVVATYQGETVASGPNASAVLEAAITKLGLGSAPKPRRPKVERRGKSTAKRRRARNEDEDGDEEEDEDEGKSIVKQKYKTKYRPFKMRCGDAFANKLSEFVAGEDDAGDACVDPVALKRLAQANDCWNPAYAKLNVGMQRMNVGNRLRKLWKADPRSIKWVK